MKKVFFIGLNVLMMVTLVLALGINNIPPDELPDPYEQVCCVDPSGFCSDVGVPYQDPGCGSYDGYERVTGANFCKDIPFCQTGCCSIRGKQQPLAMNQYECASLCIDAGLCDCDSPVGCTGEFTWSATDCAPPYIES